MGKSHYCSAYCADFYNSVCIYKQVNSNNLPKNQVVAHRGYWNREGGTQNDLQSYKETIALGVFGAETDVRMTRDSVLVLCHDPYYNHDTTLVVLQKKPR